MCARAIVWIHGGIRNKSPVDFISGKVLEAYYGRESLDLITFVPHSLYADRMHEERKTMKKDIEEFYEFPIQSIGTISQNNTRYSFNGNYRYVKFWIFLELLEIYREKRS